ncbi:MAG TPA: heme exporter protein CcmD [Stellaceae bacterium]|nr:heme exporter protein CcmD [Stellaceae bacterium]
MSGLADYFAMGGYAWFVWPAYAVALLVLGGLAIHSWQRYRVTRDTLARLQRPAGRRG